MIYIKKLEDEAKSKTGPLQNNLKIERNVNKNKLLIPSSRDDQLTLVIKSVRLCILMQWDFFYPQKLVF